MAYTALCQSVLQVLRNGDLLHGGIPERNEPVLRTILADVEADLITHAGQSVVDANYRQSPPKLIESIEDPRLKQRAIEAWHAVNDLLSCEMPWREWLKQLRTTGDADPGQALRLYKTAVRCAHILIRLRINSKSLLGTTVTEIVARLPIVPTGELADADSGIEAWQKTYPLEEAEKRCRELHSFVGELRAVEELLKSAQSTVFDIRDSKSVDPFAQEQPANDREQFVFRRDSGVYRIEGFGESGWVKSMTGFAYIQRLISAPRQPVAMTELTGAANGPQNVANQRTRQPALDQQAKNELRHRQGELQAELDRARRNNDQGEVERLQVEKDQLEELMKAAVGLGGRARDLNNPLESHRPTIHAALRRAYDALRKSDTPMPMLAEHFATSISSESGCFIYRPAGQEIDWRTGPDPGNNESVARRATE